MVEKFEILEVVQEEHVPREELLKQMMIDQAGDYRKGIIEALQNSEDGWLWKWAEENVPRLEGESKEEWEERVEAEMKKHTPEELLKGLVVEFEVKGRTLKIKDNGRGFLFDEKDEIWKPMGYSWKKKVSTLYGEKGIGRGQIIAMLYDPSTDNLKGSIEVITNDLRIFDYRLDCDHPKPLYKSARIRPPKPGLTWILTREDKDWDVEEIRDYLKYAVPPWVPYTVLLNGEPIHTEREKEWDFTAKTKLWSLFLREEPGEIIVRNPYRPIRGYNLFYGVSGELSVNPPLDVNTARNDIKTGCPLWQEIQEQVRKTILEYLIRKAEAKPRSLTLEQVKGILMNLRDYPDILKRASKIKFIPDARGEHYYSIDDLKGKHVWFGERGSRLAGDAIDQGFIVLPEELNVWQISRSLFSEVLNIPSDVIEHAPVTPPYYKIIPREEETEEERKFIGFWKLVSGTDRDVRVGESTTAIAWTDGASYIVFNRKYLPLGAIRRGDWKTVFVETVRTVAHEMSHEKSDIYEDSHSYEQCKRELEYLEMLVRNFNNLFPEFKLPPDILEKIEALSCQVFEVKLKDVEEILARKDEMLRQIEEVWLASSTNFPKKEDLCFAVLDDYYRLKNMIRALGEKVPERLLREYNEIKREVEDKFIEYCNFQFEQKLSPFLVSKFKSHVHEDLSKPSELIKWRSEFCRLHEGYKKRKEVEDDGLCYFMREAYYYEQVKNHPGAEALFEACVEPNIPEGYTYEEMLKVAKERGIPRWCELSPEIIKFYGR
jgi:hypothetical protein